MCLCSKGGWRDRVKYGSATAGDGGTRCGRGGGD